MLHPLHQSLLDFFRTEKNDLREGTVNNTEIFTTVYFVKHCSN